MDLEMRLATPMPGVAFHHETSPFSIQGDDVTITETISAAATTSDHRTPLLYHEIVGLHARLSEILRPDGKKVRSQASYTSVKGWPKWLEMGDHPGETVATGQGVNGLTLAGLSAPWLAVAREERPELLTHAAKLLDPLWREMIARSELG